MSLFSRGKAFLDRHPNWLRLTAFLYTLLSFNRFRISKGNKLCKKDAFLKRCKIKINGKGNSVIFHEKAVCRNCKITLSGSNNRIVIGQHAYMSKVDIVTEDNENTAMIGSDTRMFGPIHIACIEGTTIEIGEDCLFSSEIHIRTGDSHSVLDDQGNRTNASKDIHIGDHVWIGYRCVLTKGAEVANNSIVSLGTIVTKGFTQPNVVLAGVPAKIVKENINWCKQRIKINDKPD